MDRQRRIIAALVAAVIGAAIGSAASSVAAVPNQADMPEELYSAKGEQIWVDSSYVQRAMDGPRSARRKLPQLRWFFRELAHRPASAEGQVDDLDCIDYSAYEPTVTLPSGVQQGLAFEDAIASSKTVVSGVVEGGSTGFFRGSPEVLLLLKVEKWLARHPDVPPAGEAYLRYEPMRMKVGDTRICRSSHGLPDAPEAGTRVLAAIYGAPLDQVSGSRPVLSPGPTVFFERDGRLLTSDLVAESTPDWGEFRNLAQLETLSGRIVARREQ